MSVELLPFTGSHYKSSNVRLLVVGHSHWGANPTTTLTRDTINEWICGNQNLSYFTKLARVLTGADSGQVDREAAFGGIAFCNFYQDVMPKHDTQPSHEQFLIATDSFPEILQMTDPTHVLATGVTLWNDMPGFATDWRRLVTSGRFATTAGQYSTPSGTAFAVGIPHMASVGFSPPAWTDLVHDFLTWR